MMLTHCNLDFRPLGAFNHVLRVASALCYPYPAAGRPLSVPTVYPVGKKGAERLIALLQSSIGRVRSFVFFLSPFESDEIVTLKHDFALEQKVIGDHAARIEAAARADAEAKAKAAAAKAKAVVMADAEAKRLRGQANSYI